MTKLFAIALPTAGFVAGVLILIRRELDRNLEAILGRQWR